MTEKLLSPKVSCVRGTKDVTGVARNVYEGVRLSVAVLGDVVRDFDL